MKRRCGLLSSAIRSRPTSSARSAGGQAGVSPEQAALEHYTPSGWMLREVGKRDRLAAEAFLRTHCRVMPRTMLRYAIERLLAEERQRYQKGSG